MEVYLPKMMYICQIGGIFAKIKVCLPKWRFIFQNGGIVAKMEVYLRKWRSISQKLCKGGIPLKDDREISMLK